ncbi:MAG: ABC transporter transmembrane domain-containing protein, partial [Acidobacteriota bacterium]|nr:ABC transporter transmembrane domain-containing protein [Acidobacteriota bacterium]
MTTDISSRYYGDVALYKRLAHESRPYAPHLLLFLFVTMLTAPLLLLMPIPLRLGFDSIIGNEPIPGFIAWAVPQGIQDSKDLMLYFVIGFFVAVGLLQQVQKLAGALIKTYTTEYLLLCFRAKLFRHSQSLSLGFHDEKGVADSMYRIQYDAMAIEGVTMRGLVPIIGAVTTLISVVIATLIIDWKLTLIALAIAPILGLTTQLYRRALRGRWNESKRIDASVLGVIEEVLTSIRVVKAFGQEIREQNRFKDRARKSIKAKMSVVFLQGTFGVLVGLTVAAGSAVVFYIGVRHVQTGVVTLGQLTQVMLYLTFLYRPMEVISVTFGVLQQAL